MNKLNLLFTKDGLQTQVLKGKTVLEEQTFFPDETSSAHFIENSLESVLSPNSFSEIEVVSALNHFTLMPNDFSEHESAFDLISYNAPTEKTSEEPMLSINQKFKVQFYYTLPKSYYERIKKENVPTHFNFSGEKFLNAIQPKHDKEIHINLYHHQCEFFALENKSVVLYNNLDVNSEVDFLYFIMFTLSKIGFGIDETRFFVYGETSENDTFISELGKFVKHLKIVFDNLHKRNFILS